MSKFYVFGYTYDEVKSDILHIMHEEFNKVIRRREILTKERGNVLVYTIAGYKIPEFHDKFGKFQDYDFIKDTIIPYLSPEIIERSVAVIDESELPQGLSITRSVAE